MQGTLERGPPHTTTGVCREPLHNSLPNLPLQQGGWGGPGTHPAPAPTEPLHAAPDVSLPRTPASLLPEDRDELRGCKNVPRAA